jgi:hypothetical protein
MPPRFIEGKRRVKTGILAGKGSGRNVRKKLGHNKKLGVVSFAETTTVIGPGSTEDHLASLPPPKSTATINSSAEDSASNGKFIGGDLLEQHDDAPSGEGTTNKKEEAETVIRPPVSCFKKKRPQQQANSPPIATTLSKVHRQNRSLAFDTRSLVLIRGSDFDDENIPSSTTAHQGSIGHDMNQFVEHLAIRGYTCPVLAWTISDPTKRGKLTSVDETSGATRQLSYPSGVGIQTSAGRPSPNHHRHHLTNCNVTVQSSNASLEQGKWKLNEIPNTLTAEFTWNLMADLGTIYMCYLLITNSSLLSSHTFTCSHSTIHYRGRRWRRRRR